MKKFVFLVIMMIINVCLVKLNGQSVKIYSNDYSKYPLINTSFKLYDSQGIEIRDIDKNDILIKEYLPKDKQLSRQIVDVIVPEPSETCISAVLVVDISESMNEPLPGGQRKIDVVKDVLRDWAYSIDPMRTETAITAFCGDAVANQDNPDEPIRTFTSDKDSLLIAINKMPTNCNGTNYNAAFLHKRFDPTKKNLSALYYCNPNIAQCKPVIIFLTDGNHLEEYGGPIKGQEIFELIQQYDVTVYVVKIGDDELSKENEDFLSNLTLFGKMVSDVTPNYWSGIVNPQDLKNIYQDILVEAGTYGEPAPCHVLWKTDCDCGDAIISFPNYGTSDHMSFLITPDVKPNLLVSESSLNFIETQLNQTENKEITLTAKNNFVEIEGIEFTEDINGSDRLHIDWGLAGPPPIFISNNNQYTIGIQYTAIDEKQTNAKIKIKSSACNDNDITVTASPVTNVKEISGNNIENFIISPNPADESFKLNLPNDYFGNLQIGIYNLMGSEIMNTNFINAQNKVTVNVENLTTGFYYVVSKTDKLKKIIPLVINH